MKVGILGGGQLARMLCLAGYPLGMTFRILDPAPDVCAAPLAEHVFAGYEDEDGLALFVDGVDVVTYEFENVPRRAAQWLAERIPVFPPPIALEKSQDRLTEKTFLQSLNIPTALFVPINSLEELEGFDWGGRGVNLPAILKTRRFGYDGKGQIVLREEKDIEAAWKALSGSELILEGVVGFDRELSLLSVRGRNGEMRFYPLVENHHRDGILRLSLAPAPECSPGLQQQAEFFARRVLEALDYVGVLAIEFFQWDQTLVVNEIAPRVHNSGHWTIEGAETSQFENHLRAVAGLPLGSTAPVGYSAMMNLIGDLPDTKTILATPNAHLHLYGKEPRPGRKLGHITIRAQSAAERAAILSHFSPGI
jgi:5-(carboxyamino)imidazole ribonucleotide synthase